MGIQNFNDFNNQNEGLKDKIALISILLSLGFSFPKNSYSKDNIDKIEQELHKDKGDSILKFIDTFNIQLNKEYKLISLNNYLIDYKKQYNVDLKLNELVKTMQNKNFPININMFFVTFGNIGVQEQIPVTTIDYRVLDKLIITFTKNDAFGKNLIGFKYNF